MGLGKASRRDFLKTVAAAAASTVSVGASATQAIHAPHQGTNTRGLDLLRPPDHVTARFGRGDVVKMQHSAQDWTYPGIRVSAEPIRAGIHSELPINVMNEGKNLTYVHLRWEGRESEGLLSIGDHWERSYGDLEWRGTIPDRVMPWYFLTFDGERTNGYGVKTQPAAFCFWQRDSEGITLSIDLHNGGEATELGSRELHACSVVTRMGPKGEPIWRAGHEFCKLMCPAPRLPTEPLYGLNDWNYAYGKNSAAGILRDSDLIASLAPTGKVRPHIVIDDGWQDTGRFPSMSDLASQIRTRRLQPGLWIRPLRATAATPESWLLPDKRFGSGAPHNNLAFDPTHPDALNEVVSSVHTPVRWGYDFLKHDFTTYELFGRWGSEMSSGITRPGWQFHDRSRTNAEIVRDLYQAIRVAAGERTTILGCNTVGHLAAGIFESQRIADDTSGRDWERTRRYGVNGLTHRIVQHRTLSHIDPDCVAVTSSVGWRVTSQWMDVVARSGTSLFLSPDPTAITPEIKSAMKDAMFLASQGGHGFPLHPTSGTTPSEWRFSSPNEVDRKYDWDGSEGTSPFPV
jgi:alpha-galactosidase